MLIYQFAIENTNHWTISAWAQSQVDELSKRLQSSKDIVTKFLWQKRPETTEGSPEMSEFKSIHFLVLKNVEACQQNVNMSKGSNKINERGSTIFNLPSR